MGSSYRIDHGRLPVLPHWVVAVAVSVIAAALVGIPARATYGAHLSADEPQYLLTATSLAEDLDLDISDELADRRYLDYHQIQLDQQTTPLDDEGREVSPHDPLLPVILAAPMAIGGWAAAKSTLALTAGVTAAITALLANRRLGVRPAAAALTTVACFVGIPLSAYGSQVYPEMPAALATVSAIWAITTPEPPGSRRHRAAMAIAIGAVVALPWLSVKYVPVAAACGVAVLVKLRSSPRAAIAAAVAAAAAAAVYVGAHQFLYGGWTVYSAGDHFTESGEFGVVGTQIDLLGRSRRLLGLLVDRDFGIAAWSPVWFLLPLAVATPPPPITFPTRGVDTNGNGFLPERRHVTLTIRLLVAVVGVTWLNAAFVALTMHGWWVPGRQLVVGLPAAVMLIAHWASVSRNRVTLVTALGACGLGNWLWLAFEASTDRRTLIFDFAETASMPYRLVARALPAGMGEGDDVGLVVWAAVLVAVTILARTARPRS